MLLSFHLLQAELPMSQTFGLHQHLSMSACTTETLKIKRHHAGRCLRVWRIFSLQLSAVFPSFSLVYFSATLANLICNCCRSELRPSRGLLTTHEKDLLEQSLLKLLPHCEERIWLSHPEWMGGAVQDEKHKEEDERGEEHLDEEEEETYGKQ